MSEENKPETSIASVCGAAVDNCEPQKRKRGRPKKERAKQSNGVDDGGNLFGDALPVHDGETKPSNGEDFHAENEAPKETPKEAAENGQWDAPRTEAVKASDEIAAARPLKIVVCAIAKDEAIAALKKHLAMPTATWKAERAASMRYVGRCLCAKGKIADGFDWFRKACE